MATVTVPTTYQEIVVGGDHVEKPRLDPMRDRLLRSAVCARFGWTDADADAARQFGFPAARGRVVLPQGLGESYYSLAEVNAWSAALGKLAARVAPAPAGKIRRVLGLGAKR